MRMRLAGMVLVPERQVRTAPISLAALALAAWTQAAPTTLPAEKIIVHDIALSDPKGNSDTTGGNAYDRQSNEIGLIKGGSANQAVATIIPAKAAPLVQFASDAPAVATVSPTQAAQSPQTLSASGISKGKAAISSKKRPSKKLQTFVFSPFQRTVAFHIISDNAGHTAGLTVAQVQAILQQADSRWGSQANITFGPNPPIDSVTVPIDLGSAFDITSTIGPEEQAIRDAAKSTAVEFNVYFVHAIQAPIGPVAGVTRMPDADVFVSITSLDINRTTAHELGHALGLDSASGTADYDDAPRTYQLMWGRESGGFTVTPTQGDIINPAR